MNHQIENLLQIVRQRSLENQAAGGDGFISSKNLNFDVGLSNQTIRRTLDRQVIQGALEHDCRGRGVHYYRTA
ncbi:TPA: hypothetical protein ACU3FO_004487 [Salmonella enterica]|nr:hypothetical protein [Salmonella enterica subsp. enterica serovar Hillingdon]EEM8331891.1 hypothetical protein [Salmonella enterica subsp. enterica serovar Durham]EIU1267164.1 hypothetical protein [Salmonella enterica subsp. enterica serovar Agbeni]EKE2597370.1 hypothetical protein [Salmonella enterica]ELO7938159.1 hypothetical protein [Salmonella enterica]